MEKILENFNLFDIIAMLIPGVAFIFCLKISLYSFDFQLQNTSITYSIIILLVFGYILGFAFQEIGYWVDRLLAHKFYYRGCLKDVFLSCNIKNKVFDNEVYYLMGQAVKSDIINTTKSNVILNKNKIWNNENEINRYVYNYILDFLDINNLKNKSDKMQVLTELSRSLMLVSVMCIFTSAINGIYAYLHNKLCIVLSIVSCVVFVVFTLVFWLLKIRYEKYRVRTMIRTYFIYNLKC